MTAARSLLCLLVLGLGSVISPAREYEGSRENSVLLNGQWEFARGDGSEGVQSAARQEELTWQPAKLPGAFMKWNQGVANQMKCVWARRNFHATPAQAKSLAVLRWNRIACGAEAFLNGHKVGENEPTGPFQTIVPAGVVKAGENQIVLKVRSAGGVRKSKSGSALIPAGFGVGMPEVTDDVWIDFADTAYMKWVLAMPDLAGSRVKIRVTPTGVDRLDDLKIVAEVKPWPDGETVGKGQAPARLVPDSDPLGGEHFLVEVPMPSFQPWTHEKCPLYSAHVKLTKDGRVLDDVTFRFGMREIGVKDRHYQLNGKRLWLRGSNLVFEWNWGDTITGHEKDYLVTEAREMSMNSFRTHTQPPPRLWCDICDEHGTMILAEFPVLYNYQDYRFTPEEYDIWHRNVLTDSAGWMARLWNHPSVIMWVLSNESRVDNAWEEGPFQDFVNALDPTRPTLRTGTTGTKENYDVHWCGNITEPDEGRLQEQMPSWFQTAGNRTRTNTEYMNIFDRPRTQWVGQDDPAADQLAVAQIGAEHTEAMRRARLDGIWPYMYAGWTRTRLAARVRETGKGSAVWKAGYAAPHSAVWHSTLSPVLASLDLFDPNYRTGQEVTTHLCLINDSWHDAKVHVDLLLTHECPEYIPEAKCFDNPVSKWSFDFAPEADSIEKVPVTWKLPGEEGCYWLTARMTGVAGRAVLSQRFVRAIRPPVVSDSLKQRTLVVLGSSDAARAFFKSRSLRTSDRLNELSPDTHVVVIWNATHLTESEKQNAKALCDFAGRGGRVLVLSTPSWDWRELCDVKIAHDPRFSRVFAYTDTKTSLLDGIDPQWLIRWNGLPGTVAFGAIEGAVMARAEKMLWARQPKTTVMAAVPAASGDGRILFSQLDIQRRLDRSQPNYDSVAERVLLSLLGEGQTSAAGMHHKDELKVAKVRRVSHPGYSAGQCTFGIRDPWNYDRSRLMYNEGANFTGKQPYYYWSPVVWGFVSELKHWKTPEEYERARKHVNEDQHFGFSHNLWWSVFPDEENIMYAAHLASKKVVRFNVDTERMTDVCSYDPGDGRDLSHVRVMGWTTDSKLIVTLGDNNGDVIPEKGGWEIDVKTRKRTFVPVARDDYSRWPAIASHGHGTFSPDRSMYFRCGANELRALPSQRLIRTFATWQRSPPFSLEHLSWRASNNWFTCESGGPQWNGIAAKTGKWPTEPLLDKITIYQIWTDGEIKPLLTTVTTCAWSGKDGAQHWNYEGEPIPDHRRDGRQLIFPSYDGVYSRDDHEAFGSSPWGNCGLFLADLVPAAGNDDKVAPSKPAMLKGDYDPFSRSIRLTWARCTDNVGVDAYNVYRDGEKIATTGFTDFTDPVKGPILALYQYSIRAVDVAGNEAKSSEITVPTGHCP